MKCPYCDSELIYHDYFGYVGLHQSGEVLGKIFKCPNFEGFEDLNELNNYKEKHPELLNVKNEDIICLSADNNGFFYSFNNDEENLKEGYPC